MEDIIIRVYPSGTVVVQRGDYHPTTIHLQHCSDTHAADVVAEVVGRLFLEAADRYRSRVAGR